MNTKIITELTGTAEAGNFSDESGIIQQVIEQPIKGFFRFTKLGAGGVQLQLGDHRVVIPLEKLWALAISIEPQLQPPAAAQLPAPEPIQPSL